MRKNTREPFRDAVQALRDQGVKYQDLHLDAQRVRSTAWFNNLVNNGASAVSPPTADAVEGFAALFKTTPERVKEMIAEEWYGVRMEELSPTVQHLASRIDALDEADVKLVESLIQRLQPAVGAR